MSMNFCEKRTRQQAQKVIKPRKLVIIINIYRSLQSQQNFILLFLIVFHSLTNFSSSYFISFLRGFLFFTRLERYENYVFYCR